MQAEVGTSAAKAVIGRCHWAVFVTFRLGPVYWVNVTLRRAVEAASVASHGGYQTSLADGTITDNHNLHGGTMMG